MIALGGPSTDDAAIAVLGQVGRAPWKPEALVYHTKNTFLHVREIESSFESPRGTRERRALSDITHGCSQLGPISPLLAAAAAPGELSIVPIDKAADLRPVWPEFSLLEDSHESPLALSPDAASRHLPDFLNDGFSDDDTSSDGAPDKDHIHVVPLTPSPLLHAMRPGRLLEEIFANEASGWELGPSLWGGTDSSFAGWYKSRDNPMWGENGEDWTLSEACYPNSYWDPTAAAAEGFSEWSMHWAGATRGEYASDDLLWAGGGSTNKQEVDPTLGAWDKEKMDTSSTNPSKRHVETPEKSVKPKDQSHNSGGRGCDVETNEHRRSSVVDEGSNRSTEVMPSEVSGTETTVMLRNIPNKYMPDVLASHLNCGYKGKFDFMYLPIDFKNKCNVGYGFINFRTPKLCREFVHGYHGVEVRKCLPAYNSRKIVEVTPARVQGLESNVARLRNSPVMSQLLDKPEWLPLLFDEDGKQIPFPHPDQPLPSVKPRAGRKDFATFGR